MTEAATDKTTTIVVGQYVCAGLAGAERILTPSHTSLPGLNQAEALNAELRPRLTSEAEALAWMEVHRDLIPRIARLCADAGLHQMAFEICHRAWPGIKLIGIPRRPLLEIMLAAGRELNDKPMIAMAQNAWPTVWCAEQDYPQALAAADEAEAIYIELGDTRLRGQAVNARAKTYLAMGDPVRAWDEHERARELREQAGYTRGVALSLLDQGRVALELGQPHLSRDRYEAARKILIEQLPAEGEDPDLYDGTVAAIGAARARGELGEITAAIEELEFADEAMAARGSMRGRGFAAEALGAVHERGNDLASAASSYRTALTWYENVEAAGARRVAARLVALGVAP